MAGEKILIVEDGSLLSRDLSYSLNLSGYGVTAIVPDLEGALLSIQKEPPDLLLIDSGVGNYSTRKELGEVIYRRYALPIVYMLDAGEERFFKDSNLSGVFGYIWKPLRNMEVRRAIETILDSYREARANRGIVMMSNKSGEISGENTYLSLAKLGHELRDPLFQIKAWTQLLKHYGRDWEEDKRNNALDSIELATEKIDRVIEKILILKKYDNQTIDLNYVPIDVIDFCNKIINNYIYIYNTNIILKPINEHIDIWIDEEILENIFTNLISNAIKYSPEGGDICISISGTATAIKIQIADRGIGIPEEDLNNLCNPFYRATNTGEIEGTGLGLSIVKQLVELSGGEIAIESEVNRGTTVTVTLPREPFPKNSTESGRENRAIYRSIL